MSPASFFRFRVFIALLGLLLGLQSGTSHASQKAHKKQQETYPAIIEEVEPTVPLPNVSMRGSHHSVREGLPLETQKQAKEAASGKETAEPTIPLAAGFDPVPPAYANSIAGRLKIIEKLIVDYGRAYDYRTTTTQQLQAILEELSREKK